MAIIDPEIRDMAEFKRLRRYYRNNFKNGDSDESFINWCEIMCEKLNRATEKLLEMPLSLKDLDKLRAGNR